MLWDIGRKCDVLRAVASIEESALSARFLIE